MKFKNIIFLTLITIIIVKFNFSNFKFNEAFSCDESNFAQIEKIKINLELAEDASSRAEGLMNRNNLSTNNGMLFIFDYPEYANFWMKNVKIPLDMVFIYKNKIVKIYNEVPICKKEPCPIYPSISKVDCVIEVNSQFCKKNKIKVGQTITFNKSTQAKLNNLQE